MLAAARAAARRLTALGAFLGIAMSAPAADLESYRAALKAGDPAQLAALLRAQTGPLPLEASSRATLLHLATSYHHTRNQPQMVAALLAAGADVNAVDRYGMTPLHWAAGADCGECVVLLVRAGANVGARRNDGRTPLHHAGETSTTALLDLGAGVAARDTHGRMPLHTGVSQNPALLAPGVDVRDDFGMTALHYAALRGDFEKLDWLLAQGANPALQTTAAFSLSRHDGATGFDPDNTFEPGTRAYDIAKWQHDRTKWSTSRYTRLMERLDKVTPRRGLFSR